MQRLTRGAAVVLATSAALALGPSAAFAASTTWRTANECALLSVGGCSITTVAGSTKVTADDGGCSGQVGVSVRTASTTSSAVFANTSVSVTTTSSKPFTQYKVWH